MKFKQTLTWTIIKALTVEDPEHLSCVKVGSFTFHLTAPGTICVRYVDDETGEGHTFEGPIEELRQELEHYVRMGKACEAILNDDLSNEDS
jgi:hypothetical protein